MSLQRLSEDELQNLVPAIREKWRTDNYPVFLAICLNDRSRAGDDPGLTLTALFVIVRQWVADYLKENHGASGSPDDLKGVVIFLMREAVNLSEVLP